jgi:arylsulfatase A-like enzyme
MKKILIASVMFVAGLCAGADQSKPNVLFLMMDDLRPELNCFGKSQIISPNIDKLASEGVTFKRAYCNVPVCGASRASIMTGLRPTLTRFNSYKSGADTEAPDAIVLPQVFKDNGYTTISYGKVFHQWDDAKDSWDVLKGSKTNESRWRNYLKPENLQLDAETKGHGPAYECADVPDNAYDDGSVAEMTIATLKRLKKEGKPFFLAAGFTSPHLPFNAPKKYWDLYDVEAIKRPENNHAPENAPSEAMRISNEMRAYHGIPKEGRLEDDELARTLIHGYYATVSYADALVGNVLDTLKELELDKNTVVVLLGDHGWSLDDHGLWGKHSNFEVVLHSPLIIKAPGIAGGTASESLVEFVDVYPTLTALCSLENPADQLEGLSLVPVLEKPAQPFKEFVIAKWEHGMTILTDRYAYTEWSEKGNKITAQMLYDHKKDYNEFVNIAGNPEHGPLIEKLQQTLYANWGKDFSNWK